MFDPRYRINKGLISLSDLNNSVPSIFIDEELFDLTTDLDTAYSIPFTDY